jgi:hypothetical protein
VTGRGKIVRRRAGKQHLLYKKNNKRKLRLSKLVRFLPTLSLLLHIYRAGGGGGGGGGGRRNLELNSYVGLFKMVKFDVGLTFYMISFLRSIHWS